MNLDEATRLALQGKLLESKIPEKLITNALKLKEIVGETGGTSLFSEAGKYWDKLYKEDKSNIAFDLENPYHASIGYDGSISISSSHPYNDADYSFAKAVLDDNTIVSWKIYGPNRKLAKEVTELDDVIEEMKKLDADVEPKMVHN